MTEATKVLSIRLNAEDKEDIGKYINRESVESMYKQLKRGEIAITRKGVEFMRVYTPQESVNTDCENCPYMDDLNMSGFNEVCEYKGLDRQKALDKCVTMLWR